jgi:hypothetical protein
MIMNDLFILIILYTHAEKHEWIFPDVSSTFLVREV